MASTGTSEVVSQAWTKAQFSLFYPYCFAQAEEKASFLWRTVFLVNWGDVSEKWPLSNRKEKKKKILLKPILF